MGRNIKWICRANGVIKTRKKMTYKNVAFVTEQSKQCEVRRGGKESHREKHKTKV